MRAGAPMCSSYRAMLHTVFPDCDLTPFQKFIFSVKKVRAIGLLTDLTFEGNSPMCVPRCTDVHIGNYVY